MLAAWNTLRLADQEFIELRAAVIAVPLGRALGLGYRCRESEYRRELETQSERT